MGCGASAAEAPASPSNECSTTAVEPFNTTQTATKPTIEPNAEPTIAEVKPVSPKRPAQICTETKPAEYTADVQKVEDDAELQPVSPGSPIEPVRLPPRRRSVFDRDQMILDSPSAAGGDAGLSPDDPLFG